MNFIWALILGFFSLMGCSKAEHESAVEDPATQMFYGECRLEVHSKTPHSEITIDGVEVGHDSVALEVPCGEKRILVQKEGYVPYSDFLPVNKDKPVKLSVELIKTPEMENEALSPKLIENLKATVVAANAKNASASSGVGAASTANGAPIEDSVENWR